jgi:TRAP-type C4-dicarboxylate transport system permease small subunit
MVSSLWRVYETAVNAAAVLLFTGMVAVTALGVFYRYVLSAPLPWTEEADRYMFIWLTFIGASITMRYKAHIAVDVLVRYLNPRVKLWLAIVAQVSVLAFLLVVANASLQVVEVTMETRATATDIPVGLVYAAVPTGCILIAIETLRITFATLKTMRGEVSA